MGLQQHILPVLCCRGAADTHPGRWAHAVPGSLPTALQAAWDPLHCALQCWSFLMGQISSPSHLRAHVLLYLGRWQVPATSSMWPAWSHGSPCRVTNRVWLGQSFLKGLHGHNSITSLRHPSHCLIPLSGNKFLLMSNRNLPRRSEPGRTQERLHSPRWAMTRLGTTTKTNKQTETKPRLSFGFLSAEEEGAVVCQGLRFPHPKHRTHLTPSHSRAGQGTPDPNSPDVAARPPPLTCQQPLLEQVEHGGRGGSFGLADGEEPAEREEPVRRPAQRSAARFPRHAGGSAPGRARPELHRGTRGGALSEPRP